MKRALWWALIVVSFVAQIVAARPAPGDPSRHAQPPEENSDFDADGHLKAEHQIPAGDYCKKSDVPIGPKETHAHPCDCSYACHVDENGNVSETGGEKTPQCKSYCSKEGRRCTCHPEEPCDLKAGDGLADMNGRVIAVGRHR